MSPFVSVVIPTLNVERYIRGCLTSVFSNDYPSGRFEVIVVDNGSTDQTAVIARSYTTQVFEAKGASISALRNRGAKEAKGEILAFLDADCLASRNWISAGGKSISKEPCVAGYLYDLPDNPTWIDSYWFCQRDFGRTETTNFAAGNLFVGRDLFFTIGGFNEALVTGEDTEFYARAKKHAKVISDDTIRVTHLGNPKNLRQFLRREIWYGLGAFGSFRVHALDKPLLGTFAFVVFTLMQLGGLLSYFLGYHNHLLALGIFGIVLLILATLWYRRRFIESVSHGLGLALLYYLFYCGRSASLYYLWRRKHYYHNIKESK